MTNERPPLPRTKSIHRIALTSLLFIALLIQGAGAQSKPVYRDSSAAPESRITDILSRMTLDEKIEAFGTNPTVPRLGIVGTGHVEGLHGLALGGPGHWEGRNLTVIPTTQFPQARGLGQTWDPELLRRVAEVEASETRYAGVKYHRGGLVVRAPNADLSRDPRWGRSEESYGEDPYLVGTLATAFAQGLQGSGKYWTTASLLKHFLANSNEDGRDGSSADFDARLFHEYYSVPFRMAIEGGHANAFMTSYNAWNKVPMTANPVLKDVVMKQWGFDGIICTDAGALTNMVKAHHVYATLPEAVAAAIHAGINQFLDDYKQPLRDALKQGLVTESDLNANLRGVFRVMLRLGMLDVDRGPEAQIGLNAEASEDPWMGAAPHRLALQATVESMVLLKNEGRVLPLDGQRLHTLAVIGPLADKVALDWYSGTPPEVVTPLEGIRRRAGGTVKVEYSDGADLAQAAAIAARADAAMLIIGNHPTCDAGWMKCPVASDGKEAIDRKSLELAQESLAKAVLAVNPKTVVVIQTSFPFTTNWTQQHVPAILEMTHNSEEQGIALAQVLFGDASPGGRLTQTWVANESDLPPMMDYNLRDGRTYLYGKAKPLYAFGFGLSYSSFAYSNLRVSAPRVVSGQTAQVSFDLKNTGDRTADEVAQLYVAHQGSAVARPLEELKGFQRVTLKPGESRTITLPLAAKTLAYWNEATHTFTVEADSVELRVGGSSDNLPLRRTIRVVP